MFYNTGVTNELVRTLGLSDKTPSGLPSLKPSSNSVLPVAYYGPQTNLISFKFLSQIPSKSLFHLSYLSVVIGLIK